MDNLGEAEADRDRMKKKYKKRDPKEKIKSNTATETKTVLEATPHRWRIYTDGGCTGNGAGGKWGDAGWGAHVMAGKANAVFCFLDKYRFLD